MIENIMAIATFIASIIASITCLINFKTLTLLKSQSISDNINKCNERYMDFISKINAAIKSENFNDYENNCYNLIELFCHQFLMWQNNLLPNDIFLQWAFFNSNSLYIYNFESKGTVITIRDMWNKNKNLNKFYTKSTFADYMECVFDKQTNFIPPLKKRKKRDYRL